MKKLKNQTLRLLLRQLAAAGRLPLAKYMEMDKAIAANDRGEESVGNLRKEIIDAMARYAFIEAWAVENEQRMQEGKKYVNTSGRRLEDCAPQKTPSSARAFAKKLASEYEKMNGVPVEGLFLMAMIADPKVGFDDATSFGADLTLMASGSGASWFDRHEEFDLEEPYMSFFL